MAAAVRSDDPVLFFEHKGLYASKGEVPDGDIVDELGTAEIRRPGKRRDHPVARPHGRPGARCGRAAGRARHRCRGHRCALARAAGHAERSSPRWRRPAGCSPSRRTRACSAGAPRSRRSRRTSASGISTARSSADHHAAHAAAGRRLARGPGHPVGRARGHHRGEGPAVVNIDVTMPQLGETVAEGTITRWLRQVGDIVGDQEPLLEITTDKVDTEMPAPACRAAAGDRRAGGRDGCGRNGAGRYRIRGWDTRSQRRDAFGSAAERRPACRSAASPGPFPADPPAGERVGGRARVVAGQRAGRAGDPFRCRRCRRSVRRSARLRRRRLRFQSATMTGSSR